MTNLQKRILTAFIILPLSLFFIIKGSYFLIFFLIFILFAGFHELLFPKTYPPISEDMDSAITK